MRKEKGLTPTELVQKLETWMEKNKDAAQLDGSPKRNPNRKTFCFVNFKNVKFRLAMDTTRDAVNLFLDAVKHEGSAEKALVFNSTGKSLCLRINIDGDKASGWYCYHTSLEVAKPTKRVA